MPPDLQAKLLRVLQEQTFRKVGGTKDLTCKATIIATSNRDLSAGAKDGSFRQDLYYRLAVFPVTLPALRDEARRQDIPCWASRARRCTPSSNATTSRRPTDRKRQSSLIHQRPTRRSFRRAQLGPCRRRDRGPTCEQRPAAASGGSDAQMVERTILRHANLTSGSNSD